MEENTIEEYEYSAAATNYFADFPMKDVCAMIDGMTNAEAISLGFASTDEIWDAISKEYMITENENTLPPFF
jgi:hypothetical protein